MINTKGEKIVEYILSTDSLTKRFKKHKAVNEVSLHIKKGDIYGFIGRNGAVKQLFKDDLWTFQTNIGKLLSFSEKADMKEIFNFPV